MATFLIDTRGQEAVGEALRRIEERDNLKLANVIHRVSVEEDATPAWKARPIKLEVNKTATRFNGASGKKDPVKTFNSIVNKSTSEFSKLTAEDAIDNHRGAALPWVKRNLSKNAVRAEKDAALRSRREKEQEERPSIEEHEQIGINRIAEQIIRRKLNEGLTPAQQTIRIPKERTTADLLPFEFSNAKGVSVNPPNRTVADLLPDDFKPKITATKDQSFVARTKAAKTLGTPKKADVPNPETNDQGEVANKHWPHPEPTTTTNSGKDSYTPAGQKKTGVKTQFDVNLAKPPKPGQYGDQSYTGQI